MAMKKPSKKFDNPLNTPGGPGRGSTSGSSAGRSIRPGKGDKPGSRSLRVSSSVTVKAKKGSPLKPSPGADQARAQNARVLTKTSSAEAKANARGLKGANAPKKIKVDNFTKIGTRIFGQATTAGKPKSVKVGSRKANRLSAKETWARNYEAKSSAKYNNKMDALIAKDEAKIALAAKKARYKAAMKNR